MNKNQIPVLNKEITLGPAESLLYKYDYSWLIIGLKDGTYIGFVLEGGTLERNDPKKKHLILLEEGPAVAELVHDVVYPYAEKVWRLHI